MTLELVEYLVLAGIFVATIGEGYAHLIPDKYLLRVLVPKERKQLVARWSAVLLIVVSFIAIPVAIFKNRELSDRNETIQAAFARLTSQLGVSLHRRLTQEQIAIIRRWASNKNLTIDILPDLFSKWASSDTTEFGIELARILKDLDNVTILVGKPDFRRSDHGVLVSVDKANQNATAFLEGLRVAGLDVTDVSGREKTVGDHVIMLIAKSAEPDVSRIAGEEK